jgi:ADP-ribosylglycohydrolase
MPALPDDYLNRAYAAVLGKLIGVYLGRPFENWTYERIMRELGPIEYYVHERLDCPLIVTDDDIAGTFTFIRALEDHGARADLTAAEIGETWLNYIVESRSILWWGGKGNSTEHTAWLNLKRGVAAPGSGSIGVNGQPVAEQIGAQIFIDGWALVAPANPALASRLAEQAARVSHDGAAVEAAKLWAAMEAEAFVSRDIDHLIDTGLAQISRDGAIARLVADVRRWRHDYDDWRDTRQRIAENYGYDKYPGNCHVVPNHALMIMAVLYAPDDFGRAQTIVCTSGWDTDCNAGNVGCLLGAMLGLEGLNGPCDWRGPVADQMLLSSADGGGAINDAVRVTYRLVALGRQLAGLQPAPAPKNGAQFHFSLPGSVQGFRPSAPEDAQGAALLLDNVGYGEGRALSIHYRDLGAVPLAAMTPTFTSLEVLKMRTYELMATPLVYSGQTLEARVIAAADNTSAIDVALRIRVYGLGDELRRIDGETVRLAPGGEAVLRWRIPDVDGQPIQEIGLAMASPTRPGNGDIMLDYVRWDGIPELHLRRPAENSDFWRRAWVNNVSFLSKNFPQTFRISQDRGEGMLIHGTRQWTDYRVVADVTVHLADYAGIAVRVQGLRRYYAALLIRPNVLRIVKVYDGVTTILAETAFVWSFEARYQLEIEVDQHSVRCKIGATELSAHDDDARRLDDGAIALVVCEGASSSNDIRVSPLRTRAHAHAEAA